MLVSIQRFSLNDGNGIRTTVFLKNCMLRCPWCSNPENLYEKILYSLDRNLCDAYKCINKEACSFYKKQDVIQDKFHCPLNLVVTYGKFFSEEEILSQILMDKPFYGENGGVTFSGGEPLLHSKELYPICEKLRNEGINICFETSLFASEYDISLLLDFADSAYVDLKILDSVKCKCILGGDIEIFWTNLSKLRSINSKITFRVPLIQGITVTSENINAILNTIIDFKPYRVELCNVHNLGISKYKKLGLQYHEYTPLSKDELNDIKEFFMKREVCVDVLSL